MDAKLASKGGAISSRYSDLLVISARQALGAYDLTIGKTADGKVNTSDVKAFARDIGNLGSGGYVFQQYNWRILVFIHISRANTVDVIYAAMPIYIYLWPDLLGYLLRPLLEYQDSPQYTNPYAAQDLGLFMLFKVDLLTSYEVL